MKFDKEVAERGGFEPPVPVTQYDSLANCWFQPLTHLSKKYWLLFSKFDKNIKSDRNSKRIQPKCLLDGISYEVQETNIIICYPGQ